MIPCVDNNQETKDDFANIAEHGIYDICWYEEKKKLWEVREECEVCQYVLSSSISSSMAEIDDFWWDIYVSQLSQFLSEFYSLVYDDMQDDLNQDHDDNEVREQQPGQLWKSEYLKYLGDGHNLQSNDHQSCIQFIQPKPKPPVDNIIQKIISVIFS